MTTLSTLLPGIVAAVAAHDAANTAASDAASASTTAGAAFGQANTAVSDAAAAQATADAAQVGDADLTAIAGLAKTNSNFIVGNGSTWVAETGSTARTSLGLGSLATASTISNDNWSGTDLAIVNGGTGSSTDSGARTNLGLGSLATASTINNSNWSGTDLAVVNGGTGASTTTLARQGLGVEIGVDVQAYDAGLNTIAGLGGTDSSFIVGTGSSWTAESGSTVRTSLGLGSLATASTINNGNWSGTDLAVVNGGTGASDTTTARSNLGLAIGSNVQAYDAGLAAIAALTPSNSYFIVGNGSTWVRETTSTVRTSLGLGSLATLSTINNSNWSGTDLALVNGGTGSGTASGARTNLGCGTWATQNMGQETIWVPAGAMTPRTTSGAEPGTRAISSFPISTMDFSTSADEFAAFVIQMPKSWNASTLVLQYVWTYASGSGTVTWACSAGSYGNSDVISVPTGVVTTTDTGVGANDVHISAEVTETVTSALAEELVLFNIYRDVSADTLSTDAQLLGIRIHYTIDTGSDT